MGHPLLLTPGPLSTRDDVRAAAAARDWGSRDPVFVALSERVRARLRVLSGLGTEYAGVPLQGSGSFAVEATLASMVPPDSGAVVLSNGAYGQRAAEMLQRMGRLRARVDVPEAEPVRGGHAAAALRANPGCGAVVVIHCETTTGVLNPVGEVLEAAGEVPVLIDAMSAFGALPLPPAPRPPAAVVSSANKCLEGLPGLAFAVVERERLRARPGLAPGVVLDLADQLSRFEKDGQWRFTPPTHLVAALDAALDRLDDEGGPAGRGARYAASCAALVQGMRALGLRTLLPDAWQAPIIVTFHAPPDPRYRFDAFYDLLLAEGFAIYPGKLTRAETFRVGCIGQVGPDDLRRFVAAAGRALDQLGVVRRAPEGATDADPA
jgi:2-aminoethylphosphonate-pyruvate transaminase